MVLQFQSAQLAFGAEEGPPYSPIVFSDIVVDLVTTTGARVAWVVAPGAQGQVEYGLTTDYGSSTALETSYLTSHLQTVSGLDDDTLYHYRIKGTTVDGVTAYSDDATFTTEAVVVPSPGAGTDLAYGYGGFNSIGNLRLTSAGSGQPAMVASNRWRAPFTKYLRTVRWYEVTVQPGYGAGTGGTTEITLRADNPNPSPLSGWASGTSGTHMWTGAALSSCPNRTPNMAQGGDAGVLSTFTSPYQVQEGTLYHIVYRNLDPSPHINNSSTDVNCAYSTDPGPDPRYGAGNIDWGITFDSLDNGVAQRRGWAPIMDLAFSDTPTGAITAHHGDGHMELELPYSINGNTQLRMRLTVSGRDRRVDGIHLYMQRVSGSAPLVAYLEDANGAIIDQASFPAGDFVVGPGTRASYLQTWVFRAMAGIRTLALGSTYNVRLACASGTTYMMESFQEGSGYGYHASTLFPDGLLQTTSGGAAGSWATRSGEEAQIYLRYA